MKKNIYHGGIRSYTEDTEGVQDKFVFLRVLRVLLFYSVVNSS